MTKTNGDDAAATLRARGVKVPIIGITGDAHANDVAMFKTKGADEVATDFATCAPLTSRARRSTRSPFRGQRSKTC
jgi:hypothetical protein